MSLAGFPTGPWRNPSLVGLPPTGLLPCAPCQALGHSREDCARHTPGAAAHAHATGAVGGRCPHGRLRDLRAGSVLGGSLHPSMSASLVGRPSVRELLSAGTPTSASAARFSARDVLAEEEFANLPPDAAARLAEELNVELDARNLEANRAALARAGRNPDTILGPGPQAAQGPHPGWPGNAPLPPPPGPPAPLAPPRTFEGFPLAEIELRGASTLVAGVANRTTVSRADLDAALTAANRAPGARIGHIDLVVTAPVAAGQTWTVVLCQGLANAPASVAAARRVLGALVATSGDPVSHRQVLRLPVPTDLQADLHLDVLFQCRGFATMTAANAPVIGTIALEIGGVYP